jgi:hypothetical protein
MNAGSARNPQLTGAHLVGSVPLESAAAVFRAVAGHLGRRAARIPDGETGQRVGWIGIHLPMLTGHPMLEPDDSRVLQDASAVAPGGSLTGVEGAVVGDARSVSTPAFRLRQGADPADLVIPTPGYADFALNSYQDFAALKKAGVIAPTTRFQVSLPTPLAVPVIFMPDDHLAVEPAFRTMLLAEADRICATIPHDELAIQWDVAPELGLLEGVWPTDLADVPGAIASRLADLGNHVPAQVTIGYHLCYGDLGHRHFTEPRDTRILVDLANRIAAGLSRPLNWVHMPVPRGRADTAYFIPLQDLALAPETELYLGLVHATDGLDGARRRIAAAASSRPVFGVATECGLGRREPASIPALLDLHRAVIDGA